MRIMQIDMLRRYMLSYDMKQMAFNLLLLQMRCTDQISDSATMLTKQ